VVDRISELKDKKEIKEKTEEILLNQCKSCKRNMQELRESIKRPKLRIMGIEEGEEVRAKGMHNIFNKIITNLKKVFTIQVQKASRTPNRTSPWHIVIKTTST
jgi:ribosomal protein L29